MSDESVARRTGGLQFKFRDGKSPVVGISEKFRGGWYLRTRFRVSSRGGRFKHSWMTDRAVGLAVASSSS